LPHPVIWLGLETAVSLSHEDAARLVLKRLLLEKRLLLQ
jgi:citrate lyase beta subunit